ncbi:MAG: Gfo/Idh/MocA family oxidoreductase [Planctomycetota bacterium]
MEPVRFAILGTGKIARKVTPRIIAAEGAVVVGAASRSLDRARAFADDFGLEHAWTEDTVGQAEEVDAVYVTVPNHMHPSWSIRLVRAGKHVLMEKPIVWTVADAERVYREASDARRVLVEAFAYPHTDAMRSALERLDDIGPIRKVEGYFEIEISSGPTENVRYSRDLAGGAMMDLGCYPMGFARLVAGEPELDTLDAGAEFVDLFSGSADGDAVDGSSWARWTTKSGVDVEIACSMTKKNRWGARIEGDKGVIEVPLVSMPTGLSITTDSGTETIGLPGEPEKADSAEMYTRQAAAFARAVRDGAQPVPTPAWSIEQAKVMERVLQRMGLELPQAPEMPA